MAAAHGMRYSAIPRAWNGIGLSMLSCSFINDNIYIGFSSVFSVQSPSVLFLRTCRLLEDRFPPKSILLNYLLCRDLAQKIRCRLRVVAASCQFSSSAPDPQHHLHLLGHKRSNAHIHHSQALHASNSEVRVHTSTLIVFLPHSYRLAHMPR